MIVIFQPNVAGTPVAKYVIGHVDGIKACEALWIGFADPTIGWDIENDVEVGLSLGSVNAGFTFPPVFPSIYSIAESIIVSHFIDNEGWKWEWNESRGDFDVFEPVGDPPVWELWPGAYPAPRTLMPVLSSSSQNVVCSFGDIVVGTISASVTGSLSLDAGRNWSGGVVATFTGNPASGLLFDVMSELPGSFQNGMITGIGARTVGTETFTGASRTYVEGEWTSFLFEQPFTEGVAGAMNEIEGVVTSDGSTHSSSRIIAARTRHELYGELDRRAVMGYKVTVEGGADYYKTFKYSFDLDESSLLENFVRLGILTGLDAYMLAEGVAVTGLVKG